MRHRILVAIILAFNPLFATFADPARGPAPTPPPSKSVPASSATSEPPAGRDAEAGAQDEMRAYLQVPLFSARFSAFPVAAVDDEVVTLADLVGALSLSHQGRDPSHGASEHDFRSVLDRLIDTRLCVLEARDMGLDDLADYRESLQQHREATLIELMRVTAAKDVTVDPMEVEQLYHEAVRAWSVRSLLFEREEDARSFESAVRGGQSFAGATEQFLADKKASGPGAPQTVTREQLLPEVIQILEASQPGSVTPIVRVPDGWAVLQLVALVYPEDKARRHKAEEASLERGRTTAVSQLVSRLEKKYARVDSKLLAGLDFEASKPGFAKLRRDGRPVVHLGGDKPITVADLAAQMEKKFFHGVEDAVKQHRVNEVKQESLRRLLNRRLLLKESQRLALQTSEEFKHEMNEFERATLFASFVQRAIVPDVKVTDEEGREYYATHKSEFATPAMYRLEGLAFTKLSDAQSALEKVKAGTDFKWLRTNAAGQLPNQDRTVQVDGNVVSAAAMPQSLVELLASARGGDYRLAELNHQFYVLRVLETYPGIESPYEQAREPIRKKLFGQNLGKAVKEYAAKLRKEHQVTVYITTLGY